MKAEDIENMPAGRELDAIITERVMGWIWCVWVYTYTTPPYPYGQRFRFLGEPDRYANWLEKWDGKEEMPNYSQSEEYEWPEYSTDIAAAWQVVEKFPGVTIQHNPDTNRWHVYLRKVEGGYADADTAPLAICRAALLAVSQQNDTPIGIQMLAAQRKAFDRFDVLPEGE